MGREVRRVPADWQHPKQWILDHAGRREWRYKPLYPGEYYQRQVDEWDDECAKWKTGLRPDNADDETRAMTYEQYAGQRPHRDDYMPDWPIEQRTHFMMYEDDTGEGTPISSAFATPEELARWLADNNASSFGSMTASYEAWLRVARGNFAPSLVMENGQIQSGVEACE